MSENRKLYIADWHYAHANILAFDNRPFKTVEEMNKELVKRWNAAVDPGDTVYVLGDMFWCKAGSATGTPIAERSKIPYQRKPRPLQRRQVYQILCQGDRVF